MIDFLMNYWWVIIIIIAVIAVVGYSIYIFMKKPTSEQIAQLKEWLLYAVAEAEKTLGSGTGQMKLRYVYDKFLTTFPFLASVMSFETFSLLVDEALEKFQEMLKTNPALKNYIEKT